MLLENIFCHLLHDEEFFNMVYPHLKSELFEDDKKFKILYQHINAYTETYRKKPKINDIKLTLSTDQRITEEETTNSIRFIDELIKSEVSGNVELVIDQAERWVKNKCLEIAIMDSVEILENNKPTELIEGLFKEALSVSFRNDLGIEYITDAKKQFEWYKTSEEGILCDIPIINQMTGGGIRKKAISIFIGKVHIGKTLWLCHLGASYLKLGYNVVFVTGEMSEQEITRRIDSNVLNIEMDSLNKSLDESTYFERVKQLSNIVNGKLYVKEYPTGFGNRNHILNYLQDLRVKKDFIPDILIVDYINIFASSRLPASNMADSYLYMKAVTEELRAIGVEQNVAVLTATQLNRSGANKDSNNIDMTDTSDSWAVPTLADFMGALIQDPILYEEGKYVVKILKNRFAGNLHSVYTVGVDRTHTRLLQLEEDEQDLPLETQRKLTQEDKIRKELPSTDEDGDEQVFVF